jgi:hypothetical protein
MVYTAVVFLVDGIIIMFIGVRSQVDMNWKIEIRNKN